MSIEKVLLVDDDPRIRKIAQISLQGVGGWNVRAVSSGFEALEAASSDRPDVILLDVMMPEMDGPTTLARLRENAELASIPVIFFTAKVQKQEVDSYLALGAAGIISKPFDPMKLPGEIEEILRASNN
ncbi:MAG: response regulator [Candidatus Obscuribacterales bacterium]|jgi:CheY-like chemotaxis protein|nr:response regulator [Candidatus Obscuribacterales bacterium]